MSKAYGSGLLDHEDTGQAAGMLRPTGERAEASRTAAVMSGAPAGISPGLLQRKLTRRALQRRTGAPQQDAAPPADLLQTAAQGTGGGAGPLPHLAAIQRSFGAHDVSQVRAHTDQAAAAATRAMGAEAFAFGDRVAFAGTPSLHTAAHEAAHVIQQRGGVQLKGGVGEEGDVHEQHADAVADRVVAGQSAEDLLAPYGGGAPGAQLQRKVDTAGGSWDTEFYNPIPMRDDVNGGEVGAKIKLIFTPNALVDSAQISLMQVVSTHVGDDAVQHPTNPTVQDGPHEGARMDQDQMGMSPTYFEEVGPLTLAHQVPDDQLTRGEKKDIAKHRGMTDLKQVPANPQSGAYGSTTGTPAPAWLEDEPRLTVAKASSASMEFETTAMSLTGSQKGVYYGSVRWGWNKDQGLNLVRLVPLSAKNIGVPSDMFRAAAEVWNAPENKSPLGDRRIKVPMPSADSLPAAAALDEGQIRQRIAVLSQKYKWYSGALSKRSADINVSKRNHLFELLYLKQLLDEIEAVNPTEEDK